MVLNLLGQPILAGTSPFRPYLSPSEKKPRFQQRTANPVWVDRFTNPPPYNNPMYDPQSPRYAENPDTNPAKRLQVVEHVIKESTQNEKTSRTVLKSTNQKESMPGLTENLIAQLDVVIAYQIKAHDENVKCLRYEKSRDDVIRSILAKDHPDLLKRLPPFPIDLLWMTPQPHPTLNE